jgi:hypothetical protein
VRKKLQVLRKNVTFAKVAKQLLQKLANDRRQLLQKLVNDGRQLLQKLANDRRQLLKSWQLVSVVVNKTVCHTCAQRPVSTRLLGVVQSE